MELTRRANWKLPFFAIWTGQAFSLLGSMLVQFALIWWLTKATGSATVLAMASLAALLPGIFLGPFAGACVDRWNRRLVMIGADALIALATLGLAVLYAAGAMSPWHIYAVMFVRSLSGAFHWPAMLASTSLMVPKEQLSRVAGLNQTLRGAMGIVAPPLGALLIGIVPLHAVLAIDVGTALLAIVPLTFVAVPQPERRVPAAGAGGRGPSILQDMLEGLRYVWAWPGLCLVGLMAMLINMVLDPAFSLLPLLVSKHFGGEALQLSWAQSALGIGAVLGGLTLSVWGGFRRRIVTSLLGVAVMGAATLLVGLAPARALGLALAGMFLAGFSNPIANGPLSAAVQATVAPEMQGRVFTLTGSVCAAAAPLGLLVAGSLADALGVRAWFLIGGATCLTMGLGALFVPAIVRLEDSHRGQEEQAGEPAARMARAPVDEAW